MLELKDSGRGTTFQVHLTPRSSREALTGYHGQALKVKVKAPPVQGRANQALIKFMAGILGLPIRRVTIISGQTGRTKTLSVEGLTPEEVASRLDSACP